MKSLAHIIKDANSKVRRHPCRRTPHGVHARRIVSPDK